MQVEVSVESEGWPDGLDELAQRAVLAALPIAEVKVAGAAEVSILLTSDEAQQRLNRDWRGIDKPTNVLSFPQIEAFAPLRDLVGDISLARETVEREALDEGVAFVDHFTHLVVHGFLHLLGYDHEDDAEAETMESLETRILAAMGIADPYADD